jgi:hypothetical protein
MDEPDTTNVSCPNVPITTLSSEDTSNIGSPLISFTDINTPVKLSVTENNCPCEPCISNTVLLPDTVSFADGEVVPIPTLPDVSIVNRSFVPNVELLPYAILNLSASESSTPTANAHAVLFGTKRIYGSFPAVES